MPYREKKIYSGKYLEIEIYPISKEQKNKSRVQKRKESRREQKNLNAKNAKKHLIRLANTNFTNKDLAVHLTYTNKYLPKSSEEAKKHVINYLRRIKHYRKKHGLSELKYIAIIEYKEQIEGEKEVRIHHHIIMSGGMDRDKVEDLWGKGRSNADRLQEDEFGYTALAIYASKDPRGNKRWTQSRNLIQPTIAPPNDCKYSRKKVFELSKNQGNKEDFNKLYEGYFFTDHKVTINEKTQAISIYIRMRKIKD